jgi:hypothetical protein
MKRRTVVAPSSPSSKHKHGEDDEELPTTTATTTSLMSHPSLSPLSSSSSPSMSHQTTRNVQRRRLFRSMMVRLFGGTTAVLLFAVLCGCGILIVFVRQYLLWPPPSSAALPPLPHDCNFTTHSSILDHIVVAAASPSSSDGGGGGGGENNNIRRQQQQQPSSVKVLCLLMTHSQADEQVKAVWDTWGKNCDKLLIASNTTRTGGLPSIQMTTPSTYWNLWPKLNESLHYINARKDTEFADYDWIYKIDDDSFVIMENLKLFLSEYYDHSGGSSSSSSSGDGGSNNRMVMMEEPLVFGHLLRDLKWSDFQRFFDLPANRPFAEYFFTHVRNATEPTAYLAGGSGYVMNRNYLAAFLKALDDGDGSEDDGSSSSSQPRRQSQKTQKTLYGMVPEDLAHGMTMLAHGIAPRNSKDVLGREHFLPEPPDLVEWMHQTQIEKGFQRKGSKSTARYAIAFHHVSSPEEMRSMYHRLYTCRTTTTTT